MKQKIIIAILAITLVLGVVPKKAFALTDISSKCGVLMDQASGRVLFEKCADKHLYPASITKILTVILAIENGNLDDWVEITTEDVHQVGSSLYMVAGDKMRLEDLIYGLMLRSGNDAAWAIARHIGGGDVDVFVKMMNDKASDLGATLTTFGNPSGLDETTFNTSTARDMALIQRYAMNNPIFRALSSATTHRATSEQGKVFVWNNKHRLLHGRYKHAISGKTGYTNAARRTLVTSANNGDFELIAVTLKGGDDWNDHIRMFEYGFKNYRLEQVTDIGLLRFLELELHNVAGFEQLFVRDEAHVLLREGEQVRSHLVHAPYHDEAIYTLEILVNDELVSRLPVYELVDVTQGVSLWHRFLSWIVGM